MAWQWWMFLTFWVWGSVLLFVVGLVGADRITTRSRG